LVARRALTESGTAAAGISASMYVARQARAAFQLIATSLRLGASMLSTLQRWPTQPARAAFWQR
jgi:hypothetical protein